MCGKFFNKEKQPWERRTGEVALVVGGVAYKIGYEALTWAEFTEFMSNGKLKGLELDDAMAARTMKTIDGKKFVWEDLEPFWRLTLIQLYQTLRKGVELKNSDGASPTS